MPLRGTRYEVPTYCACTPIPYKWPGGREAAKMTPQRQPQGNFSHYNLLRKYCWSFVSYCTQETMSPPSILYHFLVSDDNQHSLISISDDPFHQIPLNFPSPRLVNTKTTTTSESSTSSAWSSQSPTPNHESPG